MGKLGQGSEQEGTMGHQSSHHVFLKGLAQKRLEADGLLRQTRFLKIYGGRQQSI